MKGVKAFAIAVGVYLGIVVAFESLIGIFQPAGEGTLTITTTDAAGNPSDRVLSRLESGGQVYVAANHWPRRWYRQALTNPEVQVAKNGDTTVYRAVPVTGAEHDRVNKDNQTGVMFRVLVGFAPRKFLRLDPR